MLHNIWQGAEVVNRRNFYDALLNRLEYSRHKREAYAVTQLDALKSKTNHLFYHFVTIRMP